ncbi:MAG TPA: phytanoyl-CoA dioxygenase family protein [Planctomycetota bacterium]|nr:phytanoyl-CoA dioxygenase family protein [Planctomycetota bacterium]
MSTATATAVKLEPTVSATPEQISFFRENGFVWIPAITTQEEVARLRVIYDRLFEARVGRDEGMQFDLGGTDEEGKPARMPQILSPVKYAPELAETLFRVNALALARQLLAAPEATYMGEHAILKPPFNEQDTPWHQDEAYWNPDLDYNSLSVWMPLQEATLENGCMQFVPGSHRWEVHPHHCINNDPRIHGLEIDNPEKFSKGAVACPLPPGGATFHLSRTLHYAGPNRTPNPRRAYILGFGTPAVKRATGRDFYWNRQKETARQKRAAEAEAKKKVRG